MAGTFSLSEPTIDPPGDGTQAFLLEQYRCLRRAPGHRSGPFIAAAVQEGANARHPLAPMLFDPRSLPFVSTISFAQKTPWKGVTDRFGCCGLWAVSPVPSTPVVLPWPGACVLLRSGCLNSAPSSPGGTCCGVALMPVPENRPALLWGSSALQLCALLPSFAGFTGISVALI